jgi:cold shock CspA family protein
MIKELVHLSDQQRYTPNVRVVPEHNDTGYGIIRDEAEREVFFPPEAVDANLGFDHLERGQLVEFTLEEGPPLRAKTVRAVAFGPRKGAS